MELFIVARANTRMEDDELQKINGIIIGPKHEYALGPYTPEIAEELMVEFEKLFPNHGSWNIAVERIITSSTPSC